MADQGPWQKYQPQQGPWQKYARQQATAAQAIEGLPPGAIVKPLPQAGIEGLPPGAIVRPMPGTSTGGDVFDQAAAMGQNAQDQAHQERAARSRQGKQINFGKGPETGALPEIGRLSAGAMQGFYRGSEPHAMIHQVSDPDSFLRQIVDPLGEQQKQAEQTNGIESAGHEAASFLPVIGPIAAEAGEKFGRKDIGGGLVDAAGALAGAHQFGNETNEAAQAIRNAVPSKVDIARAMRNPTTGTLKPGVRNASRVVGAVGGGLTGMLGGHEYGPLGGAYIGGRYAPDLVDMMTPDLPEEDITAGRISRGIRNAGIRMAVKAATKPPEPPAPELGSPENPGWTAPLPLRMPKTGTPGAVSVSGSGEIVPSRTGRIVSPDATPRPYKVTYQSYPADQLVQMARRGDVSAARELIRNPRGVDISQIPGVRYLLEPAAGRLPWRNRAQ